MIERHHCSARLGYRSAGYSQCENYRYYLRIEWDRALPALTCCGLNPSVATEQDDDRTIAKLIRLARRWGYGSLVMLNLFAYRSTDRGAMMKVDDPVGPENDVVLFSPHSGTDFLCAWGKDGNHRGRADSVLSRLREMIWKLHYLALNSDGSPMHPLYIPESNLAMTPW